jgi:hypothetical protein
MDQDNDRVLRLSERFPGPRGVTDGLVEAETPLPVGAGIDADAVRRQAAEARRAAAVVPAA